MNAPVEDSRDRLPARRRVFFIVRLRRGGKREAKEGFGGGIPMIIPYVILIIFHTAANTFPGDYPLIIDAGLPGRLS